MQFIKSSLGSLVWILTKLCSSFFINKLVSVSFGPPGIALLSQFQSFFSVVVLLSHDGINRGVIKYLSDTEQSSSFRNQIFTVGVLLNVVLYVGVVYISTFFLPSLAAFLSITQPKVWVAATLALLGLAMWQYYLYDLLLAMQKIVWYNVLNILGAIVTVPIVYVSCHQWGLAWTLVSVAFGSVVASIAAFVLFIFCGNYSLRFTQRLPTSIFWKLLDFVWIATGVLVFGKLTEIGVRYVALYYYPVSDVGLWQTAVKISDYYTTAYTTLLSIVYFPQLAKLLGDARALKKFIFKVAILLLPLSFLGLALVYGYRTILISNMFSPMFSQAEQYIGIQVLTDALKFTAFLLVFLLTVQSKTLHFLILEALSALLYLTLAWYFAHYFQLGLYGLMVAQLFRYVFYLTYLIIFYRKLFFEK